jgi:hypothetical protein
MRLADASARRADASVAAPNGDPLPPEHRDIADEGLAREERRIAAQGEDPLSAGVELGTAPEPDRAALNDTDGIGRNSEEMRDRLDGAMSGNERRGAQQAAPQAAP